MAVSACSFERGGVLIACASPSLRVQLATRHLDEEPVVLAAGPGGLLHHLRRALAGRALLPKRVVVGADERRALEQSGLMGSLDEAGVRVVDAWVPRVVAA